jgi:hypothetical protein
MSLLAKIQIRLSAMKKLNSKIIQLNNFRQTYSNFKKYDQFWSLVSNFEILPTTVKIHAPFFGPFQAQP